MWLIGDHTTWGDMKVLGQLVGNGAEWDQMGNPWVMWHNVPVPLTLARQNARGHEIMDLTFNSNYILRQRLSSIVWTFDKEINKAALHSRPAVYKLLILLTLKKKMIDATQSLLILRKTVISCRSYAVFTGAGPIHADRKKVCTLKTLFSLMLEWEMSAETTWPTED